MNKDSYFKFFATNILYELGRVYVIITVEHKGLTNNLYSEHFIFIKKEKKVIGLRYNSKPFQLDNLKIDMKFMEEQAIIGAEEAIYNYIIKKRKGSNFDSHNIPGVILKEWNLIPLVKIVQENEYTGDIPKLYSNTKCTALRGFFDKIWDGLEGFIFQENDLWE